MNGNDDPGAKPPEQLQDAGKSDRCGCDRGFRLRTNAEISRLLLSNKIAANVRNGIGHTPLYAAVPAVDSKKPDYFLPPKEKIYA